MLRSVLSSAGKRIVNQQTAAFSSVHETIHGHDSSTASVPLIEHYQPRWPKLPITKPAATGEFSGIMAIPAHRAIPAKALRFEMTATFSHGASIYYEHMTFNPCDFKVGLKVNLLHNRSICLPARRKKSTSILCQIIINYHFYFSCRFWLLT